MEHDEDTWRRLDDRLRKLPQEIPASRDLWPQVEARIAEQRGRRPGRAGGRFSRWHALAASAVLAAVLVASFYGGHTPVLQRTDPEPAAAAAWTFGPGHELGSDYQAARAGLEASVDRRLDSLPPGTREVVMANLETIRRAAAEINAALGEDPANVLLQHQLLAAYQDELTVLANLQRVTERLPLRNEI
jgi:hypothetical protein